MEQDSNNYWEQLERLEKLIRASELKAGIIFSFHSLILGVFVDRMNYFQSFFERENTFIVVSGLWIVSVLISIFYCFKCFWPRIEINYSKNVFFFKDAVKSFGNCEAYSKRLMEVCETEEEMYSQLSQQIYIESKIIDQKFRCIQHSLKFFAVSFVFILILISIWLIQV